jgi:hypothetical protein
MLLPSRPSESVLLPIADLYGGEMIGKRAVWNQMFGEGAARFWGVIGGIAAVVALVVPLGVYLIGDGGSGSGSDAPTSKSSGLAASAPSVRTPTADAPTDTAPAGSPRPTGAQPTCPHLSVQNDMSGLVFLDLDTCTSSASGSMDADVFVELNRIFFGPDQAQYSTVWPDAQVYVIADGTLSATACARGRAVAGGVLHLSDLAYDESVCLATSKGNWAVLKFPYGDELNSSPVPYDEWLLPQT